MQLEISTFDNHLSFELMNKNSLKAGEDFSPIDGVRVTYNGAFMRKAVGLPEIISFSIEIGRDVALPLAVA
jgi:hypothetical protein